MQQNTVRAAIDVGSNTIHVVVARCRPDDLEILADELELVRIGTSVNATGAISEEKRAEALAVIGRYRDLARELGAETVLVVATEAIRKASNRDEFVQAVREQTGLDMLLVSGEVEATLTFYGATYELTRDAQAPLEVGVMDLGGGSTEFVTARDSQITWRTSIPVGSGWLLDRYLPSDPPAYTELEVARTFLATYFQGMQMQQYPSELVVTGGSANSLLLLARSAFGLADTQSYLTDDDLARCEGLLCALPAAEIAQRYGQPLARARILPAGALIIRAVMARLGLERISVSPHGIREGALLAYERFGERWLQRIEAHESGSPCDDENAFIVYGRRLLESRLEKMLERRDKVLKHEDVEEVHKMRVASRRLRAALDAYESCCEPRSFKKAYRRVKRTASILGLARDADVMLAGLRARLEGTRDDERLALLWLIERLESYRQQTQEALEDYFADFDEKALRRYIEACLEKGAPSDG